jgi:hypothetical protein
MAGKAMLLTSLSLVVLALTTLFACKPISEYLRQVYKAYGKVVEDGSGAPLESVEVFLHPYQYSVLTNGLGDYGIDAVDRGTVHFTEEMNTTSQGLTGTFAADLTLSGGPVSTLTCSNVIAKGTLGQRLTITEVTGQVVCNGIAFDAKTMPWND